MPQTLYSIRTDIDKDGLSGYRITKFVDGEVESSYLSNRDVCECPAGVRPTCRHRQMIPHMLNAGIQNTHWFLTWPEAQVVDFQGQPRQVLEALVGPEDAAESAAETDLSDSVPTDADGLEADEDEDAIGEAIEAEADLEQFMPGPNNGHGPATVHDTKPTPPRITHPWRRL